MVIVYAIIMPKGDQPANVALDKPSPEAVTARDGPDFQPDLM